MTQAEIREEERKRWNELLREAETSDLTIKEWCKNKGIEESTYYYRKRQKKRQEQNKDKAYSEGKKISPFPVLFFASTCKKHTALVISNEYISVPPNIAGYVVSRVSRISDGFGHVSTNIDPNWEGALLIGLSNPTQKAIKVHVGGERGITIKSDALATLSFHYLETPSNNPLDENIRGMRMDLLENIKYTEHKGLKASIFRIIHFKRCKYTDAFFDYIARNNLDKNNWEEIVQTLRGISQDDTLTQFVVKETILWRCIHWIENHINIVMIIIIIMLFILLKSGIIPENISKEILDGFDLYSNRK